MLRPVDAAGPLPHRTRDYDPPLADIEPTPLRERPTACNTWATVTSDERPAARLGPDRRGPRVDGWGYAGGIVGSQFPAARYSSGGIMGLHTTLLQSLWWSAGDEDLAGNP